MDNGKILKISLMLIISFMLVFAPIVVYADETDTNVEDQTVEEVQTVQEEQQDTSNTEETKNKGVPAISDQKADANATDEATSSQVEEHKTVVITTKVDEDGNPLKGAILQILDSDGKVVDEWTSDGTEHESLLPEGDYVLHEVSAPEGYKLASDKAFTVKVELNDVNAGADHDPDPCSHYPTALFYIESDGEKEEVYCINQGWEEPHDISYDGVVLTEENIKSFMPDADPTMTAEELYNKVLDIVYHRSKAEKEFPDLTETEIRMITEYALKNYTSALYKGGSWARRYAYAEDDSRGYVVDDGNGSTLGKLAQHWWTGKPYGHGEKLPKIYADFYYYLISDEDHHPVDMHLYVYSTEASSADGPYQNLLSVKWHDPYDEDYKVELKMVNKRQTKKTTRKEYSNPQTGDNILAYMAILPFSLGGLLRGFMCISRKESE